MSRKPVRDHWEYIYNTKSPNEMSWNELVPEMSLSFIEGFQLQKTSPIIDIGGGESRLADFLLDAGFTDISVLDISEKSISRAKEQLGKRAEKIHWIVQDVLEFQSDKIFHCWHDRAAFHFLTSEEQISTYADLAKRYVRLNGYMTIGTFSENGPEICSGLPIEKYDQKKMSKIFADGFKNLTCVEQDHETPFRTKQSFIYCSFQRI